MSDSPIPSYKCCQCIGYDSQYSHMVYCHQCNISAVCKDCFYYMERKYDEKDIICPICSHIYYGELRNSIVKYGYTFSLGVDKMSLSLQKLWKKNMLL
jgi:hypothetical protein